MILDHTKPAQRFFEEISQIPRETEHEEEISSYIVKFAGERGLWCRQDEVLNVFIKKPASPGYENVAPVLLEAHMDMVCAKTHGSTHDFRKDPIDLVLKGNILRARDTSLGADDGFGVAYMLSILDDDTLIHPPLECLFTVQEEHKNMVGATWFDVSDVESKRMIGLDGEEEFITYVGSVCSDLIVLRKKLEPRVPVSGGVLAFKISELTGSVIGGVTHKECRNALKTGARMLRRLLDDGVTFSLCSIDGGIAENRDMEECSILISLSEGMKGRAEGVLRNEFGRIMRECEEGGYTGRLTFEPDAGADLALTGADTGAIVDMLYLMPNNLMQAKLTDSSLQSIVTVGQIETLGEELRVTISTRSTFTSSGEELVRHFRTLGRAFGFEVESEIRYRTWEYDRDSRLRRLANEVYMEVEGCVPEERLCPGGLEVGIFASKIEGLDILVLGATHENVHTVDEFLDMDSFDRMYRIVVTMLERMAKNG